MSRLVLILALALASRGVPAAEPSADDLVRRYDAVMSPPAFEARLEMVAHRQDGTTRGYELRVLKAPDDKVRAWFLAPASSRGQEMLRSGDNLWIYMPNLKRALRVASRESFQGGDFNNGDILRVNYVADYLAATAPSVDPGAWSVELRARSPESTYDRIVLWMSRDRRLPVRAEYYAASGKLLRSATFTEVRSFHGLERPAHVTMRNELATRRWSELTWIDFEVGSAAPAQRFVLDDLGR